MKETIIRLLDELDERALSLVYWNIVGMLEAEADKK